MSNQDTVILDVDGTLADSAYHHTVAWTRAFDRVGLRPPAWRIQRAIGLGGDKLVAAVSGDRAEHEHGDAVRKGWEEAYADLLPEVHLLPGARELILALADRGLTVVLATSGKEEFTRHVLDLLDLPAGTLGGRASSEEAQESKPAPDVLEVALGKVGGGSALVVGDTPYDVAAAARVGSPCVTVRTGGFGVAELRTAGSVLVVDGLPDLLEADWDRLLEAEPPGGSVDPDSPLPPA
ncbi:HAD family hydrolase [Ornithinimicrobium avium]|nr:HAD family hydrolase [Ornithinimicrobium avium]